MSSTFAMTDLAARAALLRFSASHDFPGGSRNDVAVAQIAALRATPLPGNLHRRDLVRIDRTAQVALVELVHARRVTSEDRALDGSVGGSQRLETVLALHVRGDLEPPQCLDLPLRRAVPHGIGAPEHVVQAETLDERAE